MPNGELADYRQAAIEEVEKQSHYESQHGQYGVKAAILALSYLQGRIESQPLQGEPAVWCSTLVAELWAFRENYHDDAFYDEYGSASGSLGSAINNIAARFEQMQGPAADDSELPSVSRSPRRARVIGPILAIVLLILLLAFITSAEARAGEHRYCVGLTEGEQLCLLRDELSSYWGWYRVVGNGRATRIPRAPMETQSAGGISLSPSGHWVAALGADEGHPVLAVVELEPLLAGREGKGLVRGLYPGGLDMLCWQGEALVLSSDQDLLGEWHAPGLEIGPGGLFLLQPESGRIQRPQTLRCEKPIG